MPLSWLLLLASLYLGFLMEYILLPTSGLSGSLPYLAVLHLVSCRRQQAFASGQHYELMSTIVYQLLAALPVYRCSFVIRPNICAAHQTSFGLHMNCRCPRVDGLPVQVGCACSATVGTTAHTHEAKYEGLNEILALCTKKWFPGAPVELYVQEVLLDLASRSLIMLSSAFSSSFC